MRRMTSSHSLSRSRLASKTVRPISASSRPLTSGTRRSKSSASSFDAEFLDQKLAKIGFHLVMARTGGQMAQQFSGARIVGQLVLVKAGCVGWPVWVD